MCRLIFQQDTLYANAGSGKFTCEVEQYFLELEKYPISQMAKLQCKRFYFGKNIYFKDL